MNQQDLLLVLKAFDTFNTCLQSVIEDREYFTEGEYESPGEVLESVPMCSLNEKLFKGLFMGSIEPYMNSNVLELIENLPLEKGLLEGEPAVIEYKRSNRFHVNGKKKKKKKAVLLPCHINETGLDAHDVYRVFAVAETVISMMPEAARVKTRDGVFARMLCRFAVLEGAVPQFFQYMQDEDPCNPHIGTARVIK